MISSPDSEVIKLSAISLDAKYFEKKEWQNMIIRWTITNDGCGSHIERPNN